MKRLKEIGVVFLGFSLGMTFVLFILGMVKWADFPKNAVVNGVGGVLMWTGNNWIAEWLDGHFPWIKNTPKRFFLTLVFTVIYIFIAWLIIVYVWQILYKGSYSLSLLFSLLNANSFLGTLVFTLLVTTFVQGSGFLKSWKQTLVEAERLKKDHIAAQYETLKNQVNPHFLFNSFNVLTTLVHKDADLAEQFVRQLSNVYRYVLDSRDKEVVPLELELKQLEAYIFLMHIRFGESLKVELTSINTKGVFVAPLTLQMLMENALKHNIVSKSAPLSIQVFQEGDYIVVKNNVQIKNSVGESTGVGLENIKARYRFLSDKAVLVEGNEAFFTVKIPIK